MDLFVKLFTLLVALRPLEAFVNLADVDCGHQKQGTNLLSRLINDRNGRIVNGVEASPGEFPWVVSIKFNGNHWCGGSLVHRKWVLTAAHCVDKNRTASQYSVGVGEHELKTAGVRVIPITMIILHPSYDPSKKVHDIALLGLEQTVEWNDFIQPACLPNPGVGSFNGDIATVAGWGKTQPKNTKKAEPAGNVLLKVEVPIMDNDQCQKWYKEEKNPAIIVDTVLCAGLEEGGKDACQGDSGGPLMVKQDSRHLTVGLVSYGAGCARPRRPGIYTRVNSYLDWLSKVVQ